MLPLGVALLLVLVHAASARAQVAAESAEYQQIVRDALQEYQVTNFGEAYALFEHAHQLFPSARTWRCLGMTSFELRQYVRAQNELRAALSADVRPLTAAQRSEVQGLLERISHYIATVDVRVTPEAASVTVDGRAVAGPVTLDLGEHELSARAEGYEPVQRKFAVEGGKPFSLQIALSPTPAQPELPAPTELSPGAAAASSSALQPAAAAEPREPPLVERWWFWAALGAVAAGSVVAVLVLTSDPAPQKPEPGTVGGTITALRGRW